MSACCTRARSRVDQGGVTAFEKFSEEARNVVVNALDEARELGHESIGTEHLLLAVLRDEGGHASAVLAEMNITASDVRGRLVRGTRDYGKGGVQMPFEPTAKKALDQAVDEAKRYGVAGVVEGDHVLLGLIAFPDGSAARLLSELGAPAGKVRAGVLRSIFGDVAPE